MIWSLCPTYFTYSPPDEWWYCTLQLGLPFTLMLLKLTLHSCAIVYTIHHLFRCLACFDSTESILKHFLLKALVQICCRQPHSASSSIKVDDVLK